MAVVDPSGAPSAPEAGDARRLELLGAVNRVIARRGYDGARFQDVAAEAGVAVGTLQHHFGTRRRMLVEAIDLWVDEIDGDALRMATSDGPPWRRLHAMLARMATGIGTRQASWAMWIDFSSTAARDPELRGAATRSLDRWRRTLVDLVVEGQRDGSLQPALTPEVAADVLMALFDGIALQVFTAGSDVSGAEVEDRVVGTARALLRPVDPQP